MKLSLWAPAARSVEICFGAERRPLVRAGPDHWEYTLPEPMPSEGIRYRYSIDGGEPVPDPFSRWQPEGVHGASWAGGLPAAPGPKQFAPAELSRAVIYELHVGTFTPAGTYAAAGAKLPHLAGLGVTHVELMPLATFPGRHGWGYDGVYWFAPHPAYGTPGELMEFVAACHRHGLAVLLDVVYNHLGPDGNYLPLLGPCFAPGKTLWGEGLNFDGPGSDGLRRAILDNVTMWVRDYGFDGFRLDAVHAIVDSRATHILEELADHVRDLERNLGRRLLLIAESDLHDPRLVRPSSRGGYGLDAFWADDFHHAVHHFLTGENDRYYADFHGLADIARAVREGYVFQGQYSVVRRRRHGRPPVGVKPSQLVFCLQNHDQIGNRAGGERLGMLIAPALLKAAAALLLLSPQVPLLFQGEEWGAGTPFFYFTDHSDPALGRAVTAGRQREFPGSSPTADPQDPDTFRRSRLNWDECAEPPHAEMLAWYRRLILLRGGIRSGRCEVKCDPAAGWLTLDRGDVLAVFNFADRPQAIPRPAGDWTLAACSADPATAAGFPAHTVAVFRRPPEA